jgi:hypothetical protein
MVQDEKEEEAVGALVNMTREGERVFVSDHSRRDSLSTYVAQTLAFTVVTIQVTFANTYLVKPYGTLGYTKDKRSKQRGRYLSWHKS